MVKNDFVLLVHASSLVSRAQTVFHTIDKKVVVYAPQKLMRSLIGACDGTRRYKEVVTHLEAGWDKESVRSLIDSLINQEVIVDARSLGIKLWRVSENPMRFPVEASEEKVISLVQEAKERHRSDESLCIYKAEESLLKQLLTSRHSVRNFSGEPVKFQSIIDMLWGAYGEFENTGVTHRTSPSAGALYPLILNIVLFKTVENMASAVYKVCYDRHGGVGLKPISKDIDSVSRSFLDPRVTFGAHGLIILSGSLACSGEKYGNRSMLYVPLEVGHVAQNVHLGAAQCNVATLEVGGFVDQLLADAIDLPEGYRPFTTIVFGHEGTTSQKTSTQVSWMAPIAGHYRPQMSFASTKFPGYPSWSNGRDPSPALALTKANAEAREWTACGSIPNLISASYADLDSAIDPRSIISFHQAQYLVKDFPFKSFEENLRYAWTLGAEYKTGKQVHILADHVYFPYFPETSPYCFSNSSGCAAHPDEQAAIEKATLELVERDSFMTVYLTRLEQPTVREDTLPHDIRRRVGDLRSVGVEVWVKDYSLDLAPVATVFIQSESMVYTKCASCSSFDLEEAVSHALTEVEASVLSRLQGGKPKPIKPREVRGPLEHGRLYADKRYYRRADFLFRTGGSIAFQEIGKKTARSWQKLLGRLSQKGLCVIIVPLHLSDKYGGDGGLHIVRSIVPGLVPMTFGYRQEPAGMGRVYKIAEEFGIGRLTYGELTKFPHPFE